MIYNNIEGKGGNNNKSLDITANGEIPMLLAT